ncbi:GTP-binding protein, HSR1-related [Pseudogulbenkiania sp. NH8B]|uniref:GTPase n=1 Tax=Pseudogulbenkiania sp. (strain NH8B) TaxID=748280 RepID=UPI0002279C61|nr:GTPase [Pseudogulbenkiania sp. NH8B]BAK77608.1 GTP-binding protein, HSR1-related [Pseudogulbenkiania sp. NH8B]
MQDTHLSRAFSVFDSIDAICAKYNPAGLPPIRKLVAEKRASPNASIMVYGVYNAGKSTLINALLGVERAKVADRPETDSVSRYPWHEFEILDTPGIDAPIKHEEVTREQLYTADVVIFVVNPLGVIEEAKTLTTLLELVACEKKIVLVLNCKNHLEPLVAERLKDELRQRLQEIALEREMSPVLQAIPILEVNAKSALKAKLEGKENLLAKSGLPVLERDLYKFLGSIQRSELVASFISRLNSFIDDTINLLDENGNSDSIAAIDHFYAELAQREVNLRACLKSLAEAKATFIEQRAFNAISSDPDCAQERIEQLIQNAGNEILSELEMEMHWLASDASRLLNEVLEQIQAEAKLHTPRTGSFSMEEEGAVPLTGTKGSSIDFTQLETGVRQMGSLIKSEHVVSALKFGKDMLPSVFKGIGPVTMGKIGEKVVGKVVPAIGLAIQACQVLYSLFSKDPEEKRLEEEAHLRAQQEERRNQLIREMSEDVAWEFKNAIIGVVDENIRSNFTEINSRLRDIRGGFSDAQRELSEDRAVLVRARAILQPYV